MFCSVGGAAGRIIGNGNRVNGQVGQRQRQGRHGGIHQIDHWLQHGLKNGDRFNEGRSDGFQQVICRRIDHCGNREGHGRDSAGRNHTVRRRYRGNQVVGSTGHISHGGLQESGRSRSRRRGLKNRSISAGQRCRQGRNG